MVNGVDLSDHCVEFNPVKGRGNLPAHCMGDTDNYSMPGLKEGDISANFIQDFAAASVHKTLAPLYNNATIIPIVYRAKRAVASDTNPEHSGDYYVGTYRDIGGAHGEMLLAQVTFVRAGNVANTM